MANQHPLLLGMMMPSPSPSGGLPDIDSSIFGIDMPSTNAAYSGGGGGSSGCGGSNLLDEAFSAFGLPNINLLTDDAAATDEGDIAPSLMRVNSIGAGSTFLSPSLTMTPTQVSQPMFSYQQHQPQQQQQPVLRPAMAIEQPLVVVPKLEPLLPQHFTRTPEPATTTTTTKPAGGGGGGGLVLQPVQQQLQYGGDENTRENPNLNSKARSSKKRGRSPTSCNGGGGGGGGGAACAAGGVKKSNLSSLAGKKKKKAGSCSGGGGKQKQQPKQRRKIDTSPLTDDTRRKLIRMFTKEALRSEPDEWKDIHRPRTKLLSSLESDFISELRRSELSCVYAERQRQRKLTKIKNADDEIRALRVENKRLREQVAAMQAKYER